MATTKPIETPRGTFEWVTIDGEGKPNLSGKLQYLVNLVLTAEEIEPVRDSIEAFWAENKPEKFSKAPKSLGIYEHKEPSEEKDEDGKTVYVPSGKFYLAFKTGTTYNDGKPKTIQVLNSKNNPVVLGDTKIGNGSLGRVLGAMGIYKSVNPAKPSQVLDAGVTLYLDKIKLLKLEEFSGGAEFSDEDAEFEAVGEEFIGEEQQSEANAGGRPKL